MVCFGREDEVVLVAVFEVGRLEIVGNGMQSRWSESQR
jgi:hypothetical protein